MTGTDTRGGMADNSDPPPPEVGCALPPGFCMTCHRKGESRKTGWLCRECGIHWWPMMGLDQFRSELFALWSRANEDLSPDDIEGATDEHGLRDFAAWSGATKDLLLAMGMDWDGERDEYVFLPVVKR